MSATWGVLKAAALRGRRGCWVLACGLCGVSAMVADDLPDAAAATEIIVGLQGTLGDLSAVLSLPAEQRVSWVLGQARDRVQSTMLDKAKGELKTAMDEYAKAAFRAEAFKTIAVPALKNAVVLKTPVNWEVLETQMASRVDTRNNAYGAAVQGATILWDSVDAFSEGGAQAGFSKIAGGVYDAVADAYIPGWGWFKLGASMVEGLGNYIIGYATDTATEGMLNDMFNMKGDPKGFAERLRTVPLADLYKSVDDQWELVAYGRLWNGQGTDAGDEAMKQRLKDTVYQLKAGVAQEYARQLQRETEMQSQFQPYLVAARDAEARLKAAAAKIRQDAQGVLGPTIAFQRRVSQLWEEKCEAEAAQHQAEAQSGPTDPLPYTPIPRAFMVHYEAAYGRVVASTGGSFDAQAVYDDITAGDQARAAAVNAQVVPPDGAGKPEWLQHQAADRSAILSEMNALRFAADERAARMALALNQEVDALASGLREASQVLENGLTALEAEAAETLQQPDIFQRYAEPGYTENWLCGRPFNYDCMGFWISPVDNYLLMEGYLKKLEADRDLLASLNVRRRQLHANFNALIAQADLAMTSLVPEGTRNFTNYVVDSATLAMRWGMDYYYYPAQPLELHVPLTVRYTRPEFQNTEFNADQAILAIRNRMAELQGDYDRWQLQQLLQRVCQVLDTQWAPFKVTSPASHAWQLTGCVQGIRDYHQPLESSDLYLHSQKLTSLWAASRTRIEMLQRHPTLVDATPYTQLTNTVNAYTSQLANDQQERSSAPAWAASLQNTLQQALDRWTPILKEMSPDYYEEALGGLTSMHANAQTGLLRARAGSSATYVLLETYYPGYLIQITNKLQEAKAEYDRIISWYWKTMPSVAPGTNQLVSTVGQALQLSLTNSEPGGTYSSAFLPTGLQLNATTGTLSGTCSLAGDFDIIVRYQSPAGVSTFTTVRLAVAPPNATQQTLSIGTGYPEIRFNAPAGIPYVLQVSTDLGGRWSTARTLPAGESSWTDLQGLAAPSKFYRVVWVPPGL